LENLRREKREYKDQVGSINSDPKNEELIKAQIEISNRLSSTLAAADGKEAEYKRFQTMLGMTPENALTASAIGLNPTLSKLQDDYYKLSQNYAFVKASLTDKNPKVRELHAQLEEIEKNLRSETGRTLGKESIASQPSAAVSDTTRAKVVNQMVSAQAETMRLRAEAEILSRRLDELNRQIDILPTVEERLTNIDEQEKSLSNALFTLRQKQLEAQMKEAETLSNVFIVDAPHLPRKEKFPNRIAVVLLGILAGIASAGAFIGIARAVREASGSSYLLTVFTGPAENNTTAHVLDNAHSDFQGQSHSLSSPVSPALIESKVRNWISTNNDMDQYLDDLFDGKQNPNASAHNAVREQVYLSLRHQTQSSANQSSSHDEKQSLEEYSPSHSFS
jgi:uncharacterized protein involved in exopolysaccharide biosynthesis